MRSALCIEHLSTFICHLFFAGTFPLSVKDSPEIILNFKNLKVSDSVTFSRSRQQTSRKLVEFLSQWMNCARGEKLAVLLAHNALQWRRKSAFLVCLTLPPVGLPTKGRGRADFCRTDTKSQNDCESLRLLPSCRCCRLFGVLLLGERIQGRVQVVIWMHFCLETRQHFETPTDSAKVSTGLNL